MAGLRQFSISPTFPATAMTRQLARSQKRARQIEVVITTLTQVDIARTIIRREDQLNSCSRRLLLLVPETQGVGADAPRGSINAFSPRGMRWQRLFLGGVQSMFNRKDILYKLTHLRFRHAAVFCALLLCLPYLTLAQDASVLSTVTDPFGAIPDIKITVTNSETILAQTSSPVAQVSAEFVH
jgi:hypothetical protein